MSTIKVNNLQTTGGAGLYPARAWVNFNGTGTVAIRDSGNVSSITDNGTGDYSTNFSSSLSDANYAVTSMTQWVLGVTFNSCHIESGTTPSTSTFRIATLNSTAGKTDCSLVGMQVAR